MSVEPGPARPVVGVLALQGAISEHRKALAAVGAEGREVRTEADLERVDALVIPGGESTAVGTVAAAQGLLEAVRARVGAGMPVLGTCAGMIMMAAATTGGPQPLVGGVDIVVRRNAFGRQVASFEADLDVPAVGADPVCAVFIRAPWVESVGAGVEVLARHRGHPVAVRQGDVLLLAFHPELTEDRRLHALFVDIVRGAREGGERTEGGVRVRTQ